MASSVPKYPAMRGMAGVYMSSESGVMSEATNSSSTSPPKRRRGWGLESQGPSGFCVLSMGSATPSRSFLLRFSHRAILVHPAPILRVPSALSVVTWGYGEGVVFRGYSRILLQEKVSYVPTCRNTMWGYI